MSSHTPTPAASPAVPLHPQLALISQRIEARSAVLRSRYLARQQAQQAMQSKGRQGLGCANLAHAVAAAPKNDKRLIITNDTPNIAIVSAYNDMLSAHHPYADYPALIKESARAYGATAQVAGCVPAMCDGVTQGEAGMDLSLFSRDTIALATSIGLSHNTFNAALFLGVCDKIVPGLFIGACSFAWLPTAWVPAGPMTSGLSNDEKSKVREQFSQGLVDRKTLLEAELQAYHGEGTCTFYGTANSNQMMMEIMGLHLPGSSFVNPGTTLRKALTQEATRRVLQAPRLYEIACYKNIVNAMIGLMATGGSTNHTLHLVAMARAAGVVITWDDFSELSQIVPLLARVYPNGKADVNQFHAAGGMAYVIRELRQAGLLHDDVHTLMGFGMESYTQEPWMDDGKLAWRAGLRETGDAAILRPFAKPFDQEGGLRLVQGLLGRAVVKVSSVQADKRCVRAPAVVVSTQQELHDLFQAGALEKDFIAVVRYQGPKANGMPELHKLTPPLAVLQDKGFRVALVTDGRMSGASGRVPAAIHLIPEALDGGMIALVQNGDMLSLDCDSGTLELEVPTEVLAQRTVTLPEEVLKQATWGCGRELFGHFRKQVGTAETGASVLFDAAEGISADSTATAARISDKSHA